MPSSRSTTTPSIPEVVAPHPLDQLGVVDALHPQPPGPGHPGPAAGHRHRARGGHAPGPVEAAAGRPDQADGPAVDGEGPRGQPEDPLLAGAAPELDAAALDADQRCR